MILDVSKMLGARYRHGGRSVERGLDCWGVCRLVHAAAGVPIPPHLEAGDYAIDATAEAMREYLDESAVNGGRRWVPASPPFRCLDVLVEDTLPGARHIYTVISDEGVTISSSRGKGVYTCRIETITPVEAWRLS